MAHFQITDSAISIEAQRAAINRAPRLQNYMYAMGSMGMGSMGSSS